MYLHECHYKLFITVHDAIKTWLHWKKNDRIRLKLKLMSQLFKKIIFIIYIIYTN